MNHTDHEIEMARSELYSIAKYAMALHEMLENVSELEGMEGWQQSKITKAADYMESVYQSLSHEMKFDEAAPKGWKGTVKAMKKHKDEIDNPYALAHYMKNKGFKSHKEEEGVAEGESGMFSKVMGHETTPEAARQIQQQGFKKSHTGIFFNVGNQNYSGGGYGGTVVMAKVSGPIDDILNLEDDNDLPDNLDDFADGEEIANYAREEGYWAWTDGVQFAVLDPRHIQVVKQGVAEAGYGRNKGYAPGFASPTAPPLRPVGGPKKDDEYVNGGPVNNIEVSINGRPWKIFPGVGPDGSKAFFQQKQNVDEMCKRKTATTGKKWSWGVTGEPATNESVEENKKGVRAVTHTTKPRNPVMAGDKPGKATITHKNKKKDAERGIEKHKGKEPAYESRLWNALSQHLEK
jgi:hypothetical protein